jgi:hypothetical protein
LYGHASYDGASLQSNWNNVFRDTLARVNESRAAGRPWIVANDEQGSAQEGVAPDRVDRDHDKIRTHVLWGNIMAGGAGASILNLQIVLFGEFLIDPCIILGSGVEYYFGYKHADDDLTCDDFRSRANLWEQSRHALEFFREYNVPFQSMVNANEQVSGGSNNWCLALERRNDTKRRSSSLLVIYLTSGGTAHVDLDDTSFVTTFTVHWYDPRNGGALQRGSVASVEGKGPQSIGFPPNEIGKDWVVLVRCIGGCF